MEKVSWKENWEESDFQWAEPFDFKIAKNLSSCIPAIVDVIAEDFYDSAGNKEKKIVCMEMNEIELKNNDIYFMEVLDNIIIINDNYEGILFFNNKFEQIGSMKIMDDLSIYSSFKNGHQIILYCPDNGYLIHINCQGINRSWCKR